MRFPSFELPSLSQAYAQDNSENIQLKALFEQVIAERRFRFTKQEAQEHFPQLLIVGLLTQDGITVNGLDVAISDQPQNFYALFRNLEQRFPYEFKGGLAELMEFVSNCRKLFEVDGEVKTGGWTIEKLRQFLFIAAFKTGHFDPMQQINTLDTQSPVYSVLNVLFLENFEVWNYTFTQFWEAGGNYAAQIGQPKPGVADARWGAIFNSIHDFLEKEKDWVPIKETLVAAMGGDTWGRMAEIGLLWLYKKGHFLISDIISWVGGSLTTTTSLVLLNSSITFSVEQAQQIGDKITLSALDKTQRSLFCQLLIRMLEQTKGLPEDLANTFRGYLRKEAACGDPEQVVALIFALRQYSKDRPFTFDIFEELIESEPYEQIYNAAISQYYLATDNMEGLFQFIHAYMMKEERFFKVKQFKSACDAFFHKYPEQYWRKLVELVIDDWGMVRKAGGKLLAHLLHDQRPPVSPVKPADMDVLQQYKFIVAAMVHPMLLPELLQCLIPFLSAKSHIVVELVLCKLDVVVEDYKQEAMEKIEPMLANHPDKDLILERLNAVLNAVAEHSERKYAIREFDARVAYPNLLRTYFQHYGKKNTERMREARKNHKGTSSIIPQTTVARGGGIIMSNGAINPMGSFNAAFNLPPSIFKDPVGSQLETYQFYTTNWTTDFEQWKEIILSSENI